MCVCVCVCVCARARARVCILHFSSNSTGVRKQISVSGHSGPKSADNLKR